MQNLLSGLAVFCVTAAPVVAQQRPSIQPLASPRAHLADYNSELRRSDGRVDPDTMVTRLKELGVTTYYWLIWHAPTDWEDLKLFLPKAREAGIEVWVYLVPPSESPPQYGGQYSEPFRLDYPHWAEEIARLSLNHTNLTAWVIDDFYANHQLFTPAYLRDTQVRAKRLNPRLAFLPLMYFEEIRPSFVEDYRTVIDGVVVAYLQDREEIEQTWAILNDAAVKTGQRRFHIPFISMTAADVSEFRQRHGDPATPQRIADQLHLSLQAWRDGKCDGVVTYCLDKRPTSQTFPLARKLMHQFKGAGGTPHPLRPDH
jgi:hypothetical protein